MDTVGQSPRRRGRINVRSPSKYQWAVLEVAALRFTNPQIPLMTAVKQIVTPEKCRLHGHPVTGHEERIRNIYALCKEQDDFGRYGLTNHLLDRKGRSERQRSELYVLPRCQTITSGTPGLTPRSRRARPLLANAAIGSVAVQYEQSGSSHRSSNAANLICSDHSSW
jgi:hypothetical protein